MVITLDVLDEEILKMRYIELVKKGVIEGDGCTSYDRKIDLKSCMEKRVDEFKDFFIPGTILISEKAFYRLRIGYPME